MRFDLDQKVQSETRLAPSTIVRGTIVSPGVFEVRLAGGARRNVLGRDTVASIDLLAAAPPPGTRVILITAEGPDFCAGYDLLEAAFAGGEPLLAVEENFSSIQRSPVPVVVALHGHVIGGGLELALCGDVRIAAAGTTFAIPAAKLGLVYSESGVRLLVENIGASMARAMLLGGYTVNARTAARIGLASEVVAVGRLEQRAREVARTIASWPAVATSGNRRVLDVVTRSLEADTAALRLESFRSGGPLEESVARFAHRRSASPMKAGDVSPVKRISELVKRPEAARVVTALQGELVRSRSHLRTAFSSALAWRHS